MASRACSRPFWPLLTFATLALTGIARSQCATQWLPGPPYAGVQRQGFAAASASVQPGVFAITEWDPDGAGPLTPVIVFGGTFLAAGNVLANRVVAFDPATGAWSTFGSGVNDAVRALGVLPNGELVAGGDFTVAGGVAANAIARWDGSAWSPLGSGLTSWGNNGTVRALAVLPGGELVATGAFDYAGGASAISIASWNGTTWSPLGTGLGGPGYSLLVLPSGELVAGGEFVTAGGVSAWRIAKWNGTAWSALGAGLGNYPVYSMTTLPNGDLVAGSDALIARWNGTSWLPFGVVAYPVRGLCTLPNGTLVYTGAATFGNFGVIEQWTGSSWVGLGGVSSMYASGAAHAITRLANGTVIAAGSLEWIGGVAVDGVAAFDGTSWSELGPPIAPPRSVTAAATLANGDVVVGCQFWGGNPYSHRVCTWNGVSFSQLGGDFNNEIKRLANAADGSIIVAGAFTTIGGVPVQGIARWDGAMWHSLGSGVSGIGLWSVGALLPLPNGDLVVGGRDNSGQVARVARWDGSAWTQVGSDLNSMGINALTTAANGDIVAAGAFFGPARSVVQWNGLAWVTLGPVNGLNSALAKLPNGQIVAGGSSGGGLNCVARWDGVAWQPLGAGVGGGSPSRVSGLAVLPGGDLVACGDFTTAGGLPAWQVARWNGATWSPMATSGTGSANIGVSGQWHGSSLALMADGDVVVTGVQIMDAAISVGFARLTTTCPATATSTGTGCAGSGGLNVLAPTNLPWTGSTFTAVGTGMPALALVVEVLGFTAGSVPLAALLPQGVAGCDLLVSPDVLIAHAPVAGSVTTSFAIPNAASLAGATFRQQIVPLELDAAANLLAVTSTNALVITIGTF